MKLAITIITPITTTLLSLCPSSILLSIFSPNLCHSSQHPFSNPIPLPTPRALSYKKSSLSHPTLFTTLVPGTHLQPKHQFKQHITVYSYPPILHHICASGLFTLILVSLSTATHSSSYKT